VARATAPDPGQAGSLRLRSLTFSAAADHGPEDVAELLLADAEAWLAETESEPLAPPEDY
jgi:hypothetical protein